jgi:hypothetical protein
MWSNNPWHHVHLGPSPQLGCFLARHGKCFQFGVKRSYISKPLCNLSGDIIELILFVCAFYAFETPLFYNHHNCESNVIVIAFAMGTCQCDPFTSPIGKGITYITQSKEMIHLHHPLGRALFALIQFRALCSIISCFPSYLFPSIANDTHIISPPLIISSIYEHF